jgi:hypothetical protein
LGSSVAIPYSRNRVHFYFGSSNYDSEEEATYLIRLNGFSPEWERIEEHAKEYTNLSEGNYTLEIKAISDYGIESDSCVYSFSILPPWYRTIWAYFLWGGMIIGTGIVVVRWRSRELIKQNKKLEGIIAQRTQEIEEQKKIAEDLLLNILPEKVAQELKTTGKATPVAYKKVSVLFTDFVGFTMIAERLKPTEIIQFLDRCFLVFDEIILVHRLEKIKTLGDGYMCAGGLPEPKAKGRLYPILFFALHQYTKYRYESIYAVSPSIIRLSLRLGFGGVYANKRAGRAA